MKRWEYRLIVVRGATDMDAVNRAGEEGWEAKVAVYCPAAIEQPDGTLMRGMAILFARERKGS